MENVTKILLDSITLPKSYQSCSKVHPFSSKQFLKLALVYINLQSSNTSIDQYRTLLKGSTALKADFITSLYSKSITFDSISELILCIDSFFCLKSNQKASSEKQLFDLMTIHLSYMLSVCIREYLGLKNFSELYTPSDEFTQLFKDNFDVLSRIIDYYLENFKSLYHSLQPISNHYSFPLKVQCTFKFFFGVISIGLDIGLFSRDDEYLFLLDKFSCFNISVLNTSFVESSNLIILTQLSILNSQLTSPNGVNINSLLSLLSNSLNDFSWGIISDLNLSEHVKSLLLTLWTHLVLPNSLMQRKVFVHYQAVFNQVKRLIFNYYSRPDKLLSQNSDINSQLIYRAVLKPCISPHNDYFQEIINSSKKSSSPYSKLLTIAELKLFQSFNQASEISISPDIYRLISTNEFDDDQFDRFLYQWRLILYSSSKDVALEDVIEEEWGM